MVANSMVSGESMPHSGKGPANDPQPLVVPLSNREMEVLQALSDGLSNMEIAGRLGLTEGTVKGYVFHLYKKLGTKRRAQAILRARACKLLD
jgi:DNA-binding NarL/FixJ family response regulator